MLTSRRNLRGLLVRQCTRPTVDLPPPPPPSAPRLMLRRGGYGPTPSFCDAQVPFHDHLQSCSQSKLLFSTHMEDLYRSAANRAANQKREQEGKRQWQTRSSAAQPRPRGIQAESGVPPGVFQLSGTLPHSAPFRLTQQPADTGPSSRPYVSTTLARVLRSSEAPSPPEAQGHGPGIHSSR
jgi:hypothetical protein